MTTQDVWPGRLTAAIAHEIRRYRRMLGMSAEQLATRCGELGAAIPRSVIADLENGRRAHVSVAELLVLAAALHVPPVVLICPVGYADEVELLPGELRAPFRAAQWISGEAPYPDEDAGAVTLADVHERGPAQPLTLYRAADTALIREKQSESRARRYEEAGEPRWAQRYWEDADEARRGREGLRRAAEAEGLKPPEAEMYVRPPGDALIV